ncbi:hypothetical protein [Nocardia sp. IFM 10818]
MISGPLEDASLPVGTLHRQCKTGRRSVVRDNVTQELDYVQPEQRREYSTATNTKTRVVA